MARHAADPFRHVNRVIEEHVTWQSVDPLPRDPLVVEIRLAQWQSFGARGPHLSVAPHAHGSRGNPRVRGARDARVAVATIDAVVSDVVAVVELDRLHDL